MLERLLTRLVGSSDAEDLLQDTFVAAIRSFPRFRGDAAVETWLFRIAVNVAHKHLRRPHQRRAAASLQIVSDPAAPPEKRPDQVAERRQSIERLYVHLEALGARKRIAFLLHVIDDRPLAEVAALMGASLAATKSRVLFARRQLLSRVRKDPQLRELCAAKDGR